jgi:hypothetical protein
VYLQYEPGQLCLPEEISKTDDCKAFNASLCNNASASARGGLHGVLDSEDDVDDGRCRVLGSR